MYRLSLPLVAAAALSRVSGYAFTSFTGSRVAPSSSGATSYRKTLVMENFGLDFAEDSYGNTPDVILGEARYKTWVQTVNDNAFLTRQYNVLARVREKELLQQVVDSGILTKLEKNGVTLEKLEPLLPVAEELGLVGLVANNQQLLLNAGGFLAIEGAPLLLPILAGALEVGPPAFYLAAAGALAAEGGLIVNEVQIPFVGLSAGVF
eukprot:CAMPEP_0113318862 /NCGR_PEP_ID=MMETSP0010_2-20120614/13273_1 /TAXON_ID=216773 ORGANISM="Corethron hystrix, Strain 308" /NCGR_SAMPLE_ID=MMETSP0010_2 /ASSEMBLY_ACC=CAM_ASM_000155 /LENGTH=206 /DNA_ID=CAMNT_0000176273 /DNA_START=45 /DNA_END=662 /DNA_ORIENTATION=+ /assembly_acc=CAM_ASM_000155